MSSTSEKDNFANVGFEAPSGLGEGCLQHDAFRYCVGVALDGHPLGGQHLRHVPAQSTRIALLTLVHGEPDQVFG